VNDVLSNLALGFGAVLTVENLFYCFLGVTLGTAIGVLPGIGSPLAISLLLPLTFGMDPTSAFIMFAGIYYGSAYGGSTTSILVNTPGEGGSVITALEGYKMAKTGRAAAALATAAIGSFVAGTIATVLLAVGAPFFAGVALSFGPAEYFAIMALALTAVAGFAGKSVPKALFAVVFGLALSTIGIDTQTGQDRFTFGIPMLYSGVDIVLAAIAFFAIVEILTVSTVFRRQPRSAVLSAGRSYLMSRDDVRLSWRPWLRGSFLGFIVGVAPGAGGTIASFMSYSMEQRLSRRPGTFGKGAIEGVAGPEAANNAASTGAMVPLLTLGIPGSGTTAVMLVAFGMYGLRPGPGLFETEPTLVWGLIASFFIGNLFLIIINLPLVGVWVQILKTPATLLQPIVLSFALLGVYALRLSTVDLFLALGLGVIGFFMTRHGFPVVATILGLVLGGMVEVEFRRALQISQGDYGIFFNNWTLISIWALAFLALSGSYLVRLIKRARYRTVNDHENAPDGVAS
jgi:putative tricarboxylic transport membrane protein